MTKNSRNYSVVIKLLHYCDAWRDESDCRKGLLCFIKLGINEQCVEFSKDNQEIICIALLVLIFCFKNVDQEQFCPGYQGNGVNTVMLSCFSFLLDEIPNLRYKSNKMLEKVN